MSRYLYTHPECQGSFTRLPGPGVIAVSIAAGTALISHLSYRVLLLAVVGVVGASAVVILTRPGF